jgi:hypothetical protein
VLDETGNVVLVFDDEDAMSDHDQDGSLPASGIGYVSKVLIVSYETYAQRSSPASVAERSIERQISARQGITPENTPIIDIIDGATIA